MDGLDNLPAFETGRVNVLQSRRAHQHNKLGVDVEEQVEEPLLTGFRLGSLWGTSLARLGVERDTSDDVYDAVVSVLKLSEPQEPIQELASGAAEGSAELVLDFPWSFSDQADRGWDQTSEVDDSLPAGMEWAKVAPGPFVVEAFPPQLEFGRDDLMSRIDHPQIAGMGWTADLIDGDCLGAVDAVDVLGHDVILTTLRSQEAAS